MSIDINLIVTEIIDGGREKNQDVCLIGLTHHGLVCVRGVQLHVDLSVDPCFTFLVEVLARLTLRHFFGCCWVCKTLKRERERLLWQSRPYVHWRSKTEIIGWRFRGWPRYIYSVWRQTTHFHLTCLMSCGVRLNCYLSYFARLRKFHHFIIDFYVLHAFWFWYTMFQWALSFNRKESILFCINVMIYRQYIKYIIY